MSLSLSGGRVWQDGALRTRTVTLARGRGRVDIAGGCVLPGLVNGHDHLEFSAFPALGQPPYRSFYDWADGVRAGAGDSRAAAALRVPRSDRLFLGGLRNLLCGATTVAHHGVWESPFGGIGLALQMLRRHRVWIRSGFPVRVLRHLAHAHSPGLTSDLGATRPRDSRPWLLHAAEGTDARAAGEVGALSRAGLLTENTVLIHAIGLDTSAISAIAAARAAVVWCPESNLHLYRQTAPIAALRAAGVRLGLGSDSPASGVRDPLSNLSAARQTTLLEDGALLELALSGTGALLGHTPADQVVVDDIGRWLAGDRRAVRLVVIGGRARYGDPELMAAAGARALPIQVDGAQRLLDAGLLRIYRRIRNAHPCLDTVSWLAGIS